MEQPDSVDEADTFASRDVAVVDMVEQIECHGYYLVHVDPQPTQRLIDLRWAAQIAGRALGRQVRTYASPVGAQEPQKITLVVAPTDVRTASDVQARNRARAVIDELLGTHHTFLRRDSLSA